MKTRIPERFGLDPIRDIQVLCPMNRGGVGARSLNVELQKALNPAGDRKVERFGWTFAPGDKVMQIENDYDKEVLLGSELADMTFCDPPYNVNYANSAKDKMRGKNRAILNDALGENFGAFLYDASVNILTVTKGAVYICMSSSELDTLQKAFREAGGKWSTFVIWAKNTFTLGRADYQRQYEPILYGWKEGADHYWCGARDQGDVWLIDKPHKNDLHPTMKPVALVERAIRNSSKSRDIVLDPFGGSGTTMIAAERLGRRARLIELDPKYVDVIVQRWQTATGGSATHATTGQQFNPA